MADDKILLFIPCYNCAPQIPRVLAQLRDPVARFVAEALVLDNGSKDGTPDAAIAGAAGVPIARVTVGRNRGNYNLGGSHKSAFGYARANGFTHVIVLHGDDQGSLADIEPVLASGRHRETDALMGARFMPGARITGYSALRIAGNHGFNALFSLVSGRRVFDMGSGLNLIGRRVFENPAIHRLPDALFFNNALLLRMYDLGLKVAFFPISWREDDQISNARLFSFGRSITGLAMEYAFRRKRFREKDFRETRYDDYSFDTLAVFADGVRA